jgi:hypothetical protein
MDIKEYAIEHEQQIIEDFILAHDIELETWCSEQGKHGHSEDLREFATSHSEYWRFVELHYADYKSGGQ